jgi:hypothetical protein
LIERRYRDRDDDRGDERAREEAHRGSILVCPARRGVREERSSAVAS